MSRIRLEVVVVALLAAVSGCSSSTTNSNPPMSTSSSSDVSINIDTSPPTPPAVAKTQEKDVDPNSLSDTDWGNLFIAVMHAREPDAESPWTAWSGGAPSGTCGQVPAKVGDVLDCDIVDSSGGSLLPPLVSQLTVQANGEFTIANGIDPSNPDPSLSYRASDYGISWTNPQTP